jgi:hypothetical protein
MYGLGSGLAPKDGYNSQFGNSAPTDGYNSQYGYSAPIDGYNSQFIPPQESNYPSAYPTQQQGKIKNIKS